MFVHFECGECDSSMKIDLQKFMNRSEKANLSMLAERPRIRCLACGSRFPEEVTYALYEMLERFSNSKTNWKLAFEIKTKDARTSNDAP